MYYLVHYLITLILFWLIHWINISYIHEKFFPDAMPDDDLEEFEPDTEKVKELMQYIFYTLLYILALVMFAVFPALSNGGLAKACRLSLILVLTVSCVGNLFNFKVVKHMGFKQTLYSICSSLVATLLTAPVSYFIAVLFFR